MLQFLPKIFRQKQIDNMLLQRLNSFKTKKKKIPTEFISKR